MRPSRDLVPSSTSGGQELSFTCKFLHCSRLYKLTPLVLTTVFLR